MKGLAQFVMQNRYRALLVAMGSSGSLLFCWIGAAVTALVTLRKGPAEGSWVLLWACLPAIILLQIASDTTPLALLLGTFALALVLRFSVSLALTVLLTAAVGVGTGLLTLWLGSGVLEELAQIFAEFMRTLEQRADPNTARILLQVPSHTQLAGIMGAANAGLAVLCLLLARYWQAALYNPGGFGREFRSLRLPVTVTAALVVGAAALGSFGIDYRSWAAMLLVPVTVVGFALLHAWAAARGHGRVWLGGVYGLWFVFDAAKLLLVCVAVIDAWMDFRSRWGRGGGPGDSTPEEQHEDGPGGA
jgi:hypothetical protein